MQRIGSIVKQLNIRRKMDNLETFECSHKKSFASRDGGGKYSIYVTKDDGNDMTIYGEAVGAEGWQKGARLKITALPARQSKNGKWYQTAKSVELLGGEVATTVSVPNTVQAAPNKSGQWEEKYRLTMSNLLAASLSSGKEVDFEAIDKMVRKILSAKNDEFEDQF
tara:strand:- start:137 stop:634 length:498 start_codon:yes stop_codon:yes gene_type:complete